jgi:hypothetical protein
LGAGGIIGSHLVQRLKNKKYGVRGLMNKVIVVVVAIILMNGCLIISSQNELSTGPLENQSSILEKSEGSSEEIDNTH